MEYAIAGITAIFLFVYLMYALLRPERILLREDGDGVQAIVTESVYHGQMVRYQLRLLDGRDPRRNLRDRSPAGQAAGDVRACFLRGRAGDRNR